MQHLDEHTLAFFAMGADLPSEERALIEAHLSQCAGCRAQVEELRDVNEHVAETIEKADSSDDLPSSALVSLPRALRRRPDAAAVPLKPRPLAPVVRFAALVRRYPIRTSSAGLLLAFLIFLSFDKITGCYGKPDQPQFIKANFIGTALEVFGKESKIFEIPINLPNSPPDELDRQAAMNTVITDLDGDGNCEVLNGSQYLDNGKVVYNILRIFSNKGNPLHAWTMVAHADFNGAAYSGSYTISSLVAVSRPNSNQKEIIVCLQNDRSPWCLRRIDNKGNSLGEYWHFGWLGGAQAMNLPEVDHEVILLTGRNDVDYLANKVFPALAILDPFRIVGSTESIQARGFGFAGSDAELYYVGAGNVDTSLISGGRTMLNPSFGWGAKVGNDSTISVPEELESPRDFPKPWYDFDKHLKIKAIWMVDAARIEFNDKYLRKKTSTGFDEFKVDLMRKVKYWDGMEWKKTPTRIVYPLPPG
jgi:hypothetical protein